MKNHAAVLGMPMDTLTQKYFECVESVNQIWSELMSPGRSTEDEDVKESMEALESANS